MRTDEQTELHPQHRREEVVDPHDPSVRVAVTAISLADSPDGTADVARAIARHDPRIRVIQRIGRRGLSSACIEGMCATAAPAVAVIDLAQGQVQWTTGATVVAAPAAAEAPRTTVETPVTSRNAAAMSSIMRSAHAAFGWITAASPKRSSTAANRLAGKTGVPRLRTDSA